MDDEIRAHTQIAYAHKHQGPNGEHFRDVSPHPRLTALYGSGPIFKVSMRAVRADESSPYWGWWDAERETISMIWPDKRLLNMCFPYGPKAEEERGRGLRVNLVLEELERVEE